MIKLIELKIDPEFKDLIPPLTEEEFKQLRENILDDGEVLNPIITWQGIICDGHNRWKIIKENPGIPYKTYELIFTNREEAKEWIIDNQLGRRNLNPADAIILAQKKSEIIAAKAKERQRQGGGDKRSEEYKENAFIKNDKTEKPVNTQKEIAKLAGVSTGTVAQFEQVQKKKPELIESIRNGEMTIGGAYRQVKRDELIDEEAFAECAKIAGVSEDYVHKVEELGKVIPANVKDMLIKEEISVDDAYQDYVLNEENNISEKKVINNSEYTFENLLQEISASCDNYIFFIRDTLAKRSTMYADPSNKQRVLEEIVKVKKRIEEIENILK